MDSGGSTPDMNAIGAYSGLCGGTTPELDGLASDLDLSGGHADYVRGMKVDAGNYGGGATSQVGTLYGCWVSLGDGLAITNFGYYEASTQNNVFNGPISTAAFSCYGPVTMQNTPTLSGDVTVDAGIAATPVILHFKNGCYTGHTP